MAHTVEDVKETIDAQLNKLSELEYTRGYDNGYDEGKKDGYQEAEEDMGSDTDAIIEEGRKKAFAEGYRECLLHLDYLSHLDERTDLEHNMFQFAHHLLEKQYRTRIQLWVVANNQRQPYPSIAS